MRGNHTTVGSKSTTSKKSASMIVENPAEPTGSLDTRPPTKKQQREFCGAMSQQRSDNGAQSTPQKFVRLVGCRDPKLKR